MTGVARALALSMALLGPGCAAGDSDDGPMWGPPTVVEDEDEDEDDRDEPAPDGSDGDEDGGELEPEGSTGWSGADGSDDGEPLPPNDDGTTGDAPADDGMPPPGDDGMPPPGDDGGVPQGDIEAQCQSYCGALQACGIIPGDAATFGGCVDGCATPETPSCDAAWSDVMSCVTSLDCFQMQVWNVGFPGYPCSAEEQAYFSC